MLFFFKTFLGATLLIAPLCTQEMARHAFEWEQLQIGLDNTAIRLATRDRALFNFIEAQNRRIRQLETVHDKAHQCARTAPVPACVASDQTLEVTIRSIFTHTLWQAHQTWRTTGEAARSDLRRLGEGRLIRESTLPFNSEVCKRCFLPIQLKPKNFDRIGSSIHGDPKRFMRVAVRYRTDVRGWNYVLGE